MNFEPIVDPDISFLSESASLVLSATPVSMSPYAQQLLVEIIYADNGQLNKAYCIYNTDSQAYTVNISDYIGGNIATEITSIDVAWRATSGVTFAIVYIDKDDPSYLSTTIGNRIAIVKNGVLIDDDIIETQSGEVANNDINNVYINSSATQVVFTSAANNLVSYLDINEAPDVFLLDIVNATLARVSQITNDDEGSNPSSALGFTQINGDTKVLIETTAPEFSTIDSNEINDLYLVTLDASENTIDLITQTIANDAGSVADEQAIIAGNSIVYVSNSDDLVSGDSNQSNDIFIHNIQTDTRLRLTSNLDSILGDAYGLVEYELLGLSDDVSKLMFSSNYETLEKSPDLYQVYLMNTNDSSIEILSQTPGGDSGNDASLLGVMDSVGSNYAYQTEATNLLADAPGILITNIDARSATISTDTTIATDDTAATITKLTGDVTVDLWDASATSATTSIAIDAGEIIIENTVSFDEVKLSVPSAYDFDINISDAIDVLRHIVNLETLTGNAFHAADTDNNGSVNISDAIDVLRHIVNLETIDTFDLIDSSGNRVSELDANASGDAPTWTLVANGNVDMSGSGFDGDYVVAMDIV
jgi:hypothetical protein